jgi:hypothetical protein
VRDRAFVIRHYALVSEHSVALVVAVAVAGCAGLTGCQDTVSLGFKNPCSFAVEVIEDGIRLHTDDVDYHVVDVGSTVRVLEDDAKWSSQEWRIRRDGSEAIGDLVVTDRSQSTVPDDDSFDFVVSVDPALCAQLP